MGRTTGTTGTTTRHTARDTARRAPEKPCALCRDNVQWVDYKNLPLLRSYLSDRGRIRARRMTGNCARHQHEIAMAIKTARQLVLLPYAPRPVTAAPVGATVTAGEKAPAPEKAPERAAAKATALSDRRATADVTGGVR